MVSVCGCEITRGADELTFFHSGNNRGEVVIHQDHVGGLFGDISAFDAIGLALVFSTF